MSLSRVLVVGGRGALGAKLVEHFKAGGFWVLSVDVAESEEAHANVVVDAKADLVQQESSLLADVGRYLEGGHSLSAVLCVAGGWAGGNIAAENSLKNANLMLQQSVWTSMLAARLASLHLAPTGLLQLTGAAAATSPTPSMLGYGLAKAAVHQLAASLAAKGSGLPTESTVIALLPVTLDTPMNRKWMPKADHSKWTPLDWIAKQLLEYVKEPSSRPPSGTLLTLSTENGETKAIPAML